MQEGGLWFIFGALASNPAAFLFSSPQVFLRLFRIKHKTRDIGKEKTSYQ